MKFNYSKQFVSLVERMSQRDEEDLKFIGFGNPNAKILIIAKEASIDKKDEQYTREIKNNIDDWHKNIDESFSQEDVCKWDCDEEFNPLYPYKGRLNKICRRNEDNGGTSATWYNYQKLVDKILKRPKNEYIDFLEHCFITELSTEVRPYSGGYSEATQRSIDIRCKELLSDDFFRSFPIVIVACGHYLDMYNIDLEKIFNQKYIRMEKDNKLWLNIHEKDGRLLIHTRHLAMCSNALIDMIADNVQKFL